MDVAHLRETEPLAAELFADGRLDDLARWGERLADLGVSPAASGNLSCRSGNGFLISATGVPLGALTRDAWVEVTDVTPLADGGLRIGSRGLHEPSRDAAVHAAVYGHDPEAMAVFHLHPDYLDVLGDDLGVPATATFHRAGTVESVHEIERFLEAHPDADYFVLVDHGIVARAPTIEAAGEAVEQYHRGVARARG